MKKNVRQSKTRPKKLAVKLSLYISAILLVVFILLILIIGVTIQKDLAKREQEKLAFLAEENSIIVRDFMETMVYKQEVVISAVKNMRNIGSEQKLQLIGGILTDTLAGEDSILSLFMVAEPNVFREGTPNGYSIFASAAGTVAEDEMFNNVDEASYNKVKENKKFMVVDPFQKVIDGKEYKVITVLQPILDPKGNVTGVIGSNIDVALLNGQEYDKGGFESFANQIVCGHGTIITDSVKPDRIGAKFTEASDSTNTQKILDSGQDSKPFNFVDTNKDGTKYHKSFVPFYVGDSDIVWLSGTSILQTEFNSTIIKQLTIIGTFLIIALFLLTALSFVRIRKMLRPVNELNEVVKGMAQGDLQGIIEHDSDDELGSLANNLRISILSLHGYIEDIARAMNEMANKNFNLVPSQPFIGEFAAIEKSILKFTIDISKAFSHMDIAADQVYSSSGQIASGAQELSQGATEEAGVVEELASTIDLISQQIKANAENAQEASLKVGAVDDEITESNRQMEEMTVAMANISNSSKEIGKVIKTIEDIAFQTNILALNAAVEAARAGEAGKGFAVVADEVRNLASKSAEAAKGTTTLIEESVQAVKEGLCIAETTAKTLQAVVGGAKEVTGKVNEIAEASVEQANAINRVTDGIAQISLVVHTTAATAEESAAASEELSGQSQALKNQISKFKLKL